MTPPSQPDEGNGRRWFFEQEYYKRTFNGLRDHELRIRVLEKSLWKFIGIAIGASTVFTLISKLVTTLLK